MNTIMQSIQKQWDELYFVREVVIDQTTGEVSRKLTLRKIRKVNCEPS